MPDFQIQSSIYIISVVLKCFLSMPQENVLKHNNARLLQLNLLKLQLIILIWQDVSFSTCNWIQSETMGRLLKCLNDDVDIKICINKPIYEDSKPTLLHNWIVSVIYIWFMDIKYSKGAMTRYISIRNCDIKNTSKSLKPYNLLPIWIN